MPSLANTHVLLADDHAINRQYLRLALAPHVACLSEANNGIAATELTLRLRPQLLLLDIQMPRLDGLAALKHIRRHWQGQDTSAHSGQLLPPPAIALTADARECERERLLSAGFDAYLAKPIRMASLLNSMQAVLQGQPGIDTIGEGFQSAAEPFENQASENVTDHSSAPGKQQAPWLQDNSVPRNAVADSPLVPGQLSDFGGLKATDGDPQLLQRLRDLFQEELSNFLGHAGAQLSRWELVPLAAEVHRLIASAGYCGAGRFEVMARDFHARLLAAESEPLAAAWVRFRREALVLLQRLDSSMATEQGPAMKQTEHSSDPAPAVPASQHRADNSR